MAGPDIPKATAVFRPAGERHPAHNRQRRVDGRTSGVTLEAVRRALTAGLPPPAAEVPATLDAVRRALTAGLPPPAAEVPATLGAVQANIISK
jgi:hypothetical protein